MCYPTDAGWRIKIERGLHVPSFLECLDIFPIVIFSYPLLSVFRGLRAGFLYCENVYRNKLVRK
jgi:hypothetical protein